jgi:hypothetical protein
MGLVAGRGCSPIFHHRIIDPSRAPERDCNQADLELNVTVTKPRLASHVYRLKAASRYRFRRRKP